MKKTVAATLYSLLQEDKRGITAEVTIISHKSDGEVVAEYEGARYWAIRKPETGEYLVNLDSKVKPKHKVLMVHPDCSARVKEITDVNDLRKLLHQSYEIVSSPRLPAPYSMVLKEEHILIGLPISQVGSWLYYSEETCLNVEGDIILIRHTKPNPNGEISIVGMSKGDIQFLVKELKLKLIVDPT